MPFIQDIKYLVIQRKEKSWGWSDHMIRDTTWSILMTGSNVVFCCSLPRLAFITTSTTAYYTTHNVHSLSTTHIFIHITPVFFSIMQLCLPGCLKELNDMEKNIFVWLLMKCNLVVFVEALHFMSRHELSPEFIYCPFISLSYI